jgi:hypothetical protein
VSLPWTSEWVVTATNTRHTAAFNVGCDRISPGGGIDPGPAGCHMKPAETEYLHSHIDTRQLVRLRRRHPLQKNQERRQKGYSDHGSSAIENSLHRGNRGLAGQRSPLVGRSAAQFKGSAVTATFGSINGAIGTLAGGLVRRVMSATS